MRLIDIVALTGNVATALHGVEAHIVHVEIGRETPALDDAVADMRRLSEALEKVLPNGVHEACVLAGSIDQIRLSLEALPEGERHNCETRMLYSLGRAVTGFAELIDCLHELSLEVETNAEKSVAISG